LNVNLADLLVEEKLVSAEQIRVAADGAAASGRDVLHQLLFAGLIAEDHLMNAFVKRYSLPAVKLTAISPAALESMPIESMLKYRCVPFQVDPGGVLRVAIADPRSLTFLETYRSPQVKAVASSFIPFSVLESALKRISEIPKGSATPAPTRTTSTQVPRPETAATGVNATKQYSKGPAVRRFRAQDQASSILDQILIEAVSRGASDVHIEPQANMICVRFRYEGVLFDVFEIPNELKEQISNRVKVTAGLDIAERRMPQDGRARLKVGNGEVNFRTSVMPSFYGETIVFRVLRQTDLQLDVGKLGLDEKQLATLRKGIEAPNGLLLITGPTGSGKTSTLYSALSTLNGRDVKIATVEDPVEFHLPGITQVQVNKDAGLDFAEVLKSLLRQDPDIILVGEVRDQETAAIAVQAALTGHLVLSSLHTNDAASAVLRLLNMKVEPFAVLAAINTVVGQRLIRKVCPDCSESTQYTEQQLSWLGADRALIEGGSHRRGKGCEKCLGGGYRGRLAIFEVLELDDTLKEMFLKGDNLIDVKRQAIKNGMKTLRQSALALVAAGTTTLEEAIASTFER
jgi:type IV pilus assembly protein PilB